MLVKQPAGTSIPAAASAVHGITTEIANAAGAHPRTALAIWDRFARNAETVVAHNLQFDWFVLDGVWRRYWSKDAASAPTSIEFLHGGHKKLCTMEMASPILALPPTPKMVASGYAKNKPPSLAECVRFFFNEEIDGAHDAMVDVRACARVYFKMAQMRAQAEAA